MGNVSLNQGICSPGRFLDRCQRGATTEGTHATPCSTSGMENAPTGTVSSRLVRNGCPSPPLRVSLCGQRPSRRIRRLRSRLSYFGLKEFGCGRAVNPETFA
jgi:hypothetical protein